MGSAAQVDAKSAYRHLASSELVSSDHVDQHNRHRSRVAPHKVSAAQLLYIFLGASICAPLHFTHCWVGNMGSPVPFRRRRGAGNHGLLRKATLSLLRGKPLILDHQSHPHRSEFALPLRRKSERSAALFLLYISDFLSYPLPCIIIISPSNFTSLVRRSHLTSVAER